LSWFCDWWSLRFIKLFCFGYNLVWWNLWLFHIDFLRFICRWFIHLLRLITKESFFIFKCFYELLSHLLWILKRVETTSSWIGSAWGCVSYRLCSFCSSHYFGYNWFEIKLRDLQFHFCKCCGFCFWTETDLNLYPAFARYHSFHRKDLYIWMLSLVLEFKLEIKRNFRLYREFLKD
jgi:hypothetical protein